MTETQAKTPDESNSSRYFRIRKEVIGLLLLGIGCWTAFQVNDWWSHMNWPPHDGRNQDTVKAIACPHMKYNLLKSDIETISAIGGSSMHIDRKMFFENPNCAASLYLYSEGTGIRSKYYIYDRVSKRQTAIIEITHAQITEGELK